VKGFHHFGEKARKLDTQKNLGLEMIK